MVVDPITSITSTKTAIVPNISSRRIPTSKTGGVRDPEVPELVAITISTAVEARQEAVRQLLTMVAVAAKT